MRASLESIWRSGKWLEALALIGGAIVVVVTVTAVRASGPVHSRAPSREASARHRVSVASADSPPGAAEAATKYLRLLAETAAGGTADSRQSVSAMTTGPLKSELEQGLPTLTRALRVRLQSAAAPTAFDGWPLGYKITSFSTKAAIVSVWHLDLAASSALGVMATDYATTTYDVRWLASSWRIDSAATVPGPTPPPPNAQPTEIDHFAKALQGFSGYSYVP
jgi:hypothetical protein